MIRLFDTHRIRKCRELSGRLWDFAVLDGPRKGEKRRVTVPSCVEKYPGLENYRGKMLYETTFEARGDIRLEFKGVSHFAAVKIDGQEVESHYGSYTPFAVYAKGLAYGSHCLQVEVDNRFLEEYALDIPNDYTSYGGISRGAVLEEVSRLHFTWLHITPLSAGADGWNIRIEAEGYNLAEEARDAEVCVRIAGQEYWMESKTVSPGEGCIWSREATVRGVRTWSPEDPALYSAEAQLYIDGKAEDDLIERIGFRTVQVKDNRILLNGKAIRIKGFCRHEDHPQFGCALPLEAMDSDLRLIRDMGGNSVRTSHYPNDELFLDLCDELGILVWEENHARGLEEADMRNPWFEEQCEQVIREMITAHYNHPSIYIWGILNECGSETEYGRICYSAQYSLIRSLDVSRPCSSASCKFFKDICQDLPDVCSWNIYPYWYDDETAVEKLEKLSDWLNGEGKGAGKPFLITEIGAGAVYGFRDPAKDVWSEERQAEILKKQLEEVTSFAGCMGLYIWQFSDVRVSKEWAMKRPKSRNNKGLVDEYRRPKLAYQTVKEIFGSLPDYWEE